MSGSAFLPGPPVVARRLVESMADRFPLWRLDLPSAPESVVEARHRMVAALRQRPEADSLVDTAALLVSELVTNAVLHGRAALQVSTFADTDLVRVEVADGSPVLPKTKPARPDGTTGRGLQLVAALASRWGSERVVSPELRKVVWFELDRTTDPGSGGGHLTFDWASTPPL